MTPTDFARHLTAFLARYLPDQRSVSANTVKSYRDAFILLLRYLRDEKALPPEKVALDALDAPLVVSWLAYLEKERASSTRTCNQRLAAIHSFFRYLQSEEPARLLQVQRILAIPARRCPRSPIAYLSTDELRLLLEQPDLSTQRGRRDAVLLSVLYDTAARSQEALDLRARDIRLDAPAQLRLTGKGRKTRIVPLMPSTTALLREHLHAGGLDRPDRTDAPVFWSKHGQPFSRSGLRHLVQQYADSARARCPDIPARLGPHILRHTKAMHLLQAGVPLIHIRDILGHVDIKTTEVYARADLEMKRRALEKAQLPPVPGASPMPSWRDDKDLMAWLHALTRGATP